MREGTRERKRERERERAINNNYTYERKRVNVISTTTQRWCEGLECGNSNSPTNDSFFNMCKHSSHCGKTENS